MEITNILKTELDMPNRTINDSLHTLNGHDRHLGRNVVKVALHNESKGAIEVYHWTNLLIQGGQLVFEALIPTDGASKIVNRFRRTDYVEIFIQEKTEDPFLQKFVEDISEKWVLIEKEILITRDDFTTIQFTLIPVRKYYEKINKNYI